MIIINFDASVPYYDNIDINLTNGIATSQLTWYITYQLYQNTVSPPYPAPVWPPYGRNSGLTSGTSHVNMLANMPQIYQLIITEITVFNADTVSQMVVISFFDGLSSAFSTLIQCSIPPGYTLSYNATPGTGGSWTLLDMSGKGTGI